MMMDGRRGAWARWTPAATDHVDAFSYQNVGHRDTGRSLFLALAANGAFYASEQPVALRLISVATSEVLVLPIPTRSVPDAPAPSFPLTRDHIQTFLQQGVLVLPNLVADHLWCEALRHINMALAPGSGMLGADPDDANNFHPELRQHPSIRALLYSSPLFGVLEQLLGGGRAKRPNMAQIALRYPNLKRDPKDDLWHIDGMKTWHKSPFQLLVGVALSAQPTDDCGGLTVWPGHHRTLHEAVQKVRGMRPEPGKSVARSEDLLDDDLAAEAAEKADDYSNGDPWLGTRPKLPPSDAIQLQLQPGDVVIAHQKMPHRVAPNKSPHIRYQAYFRVSHVGHLPNASLDGGLWHGFEALRPLVAGGDATICPVD